MSFFWKKIYLIQIDVKQIINLRCIRHVRHIVHQSLYTCTAKAGASLASVEVGRQKQTKIGTEIRLNVRPFPGYTHIAKC